MDLSILFEDEDIVVINKPPFVVVNRAESVREETVQDWMENKIGIQEYSNTENSDEMSLFVNRGGIVHRLDKDTSGVLILAKNPKALIELMRQFKERETKKEYVALVHGKVTPEEGVIRLPMARSKFDRQEFAVDPEGKIAETGFKVLSYFRFKVTERKFKKLMHLYNQGFSLVRLFPKTGRTHQIRVHLSHRHYPIVGDVKYVGRKRAKADLSWCERQFLHAEKLVVKHPTTGKEMIFTAPLADDLKIVLSRIFEV